MTKVHVQAPTSIILLCGGRTSNLSETVPLSLRDAFLKILDYKTIKAHDLVQIEDTPAYEIFSQNYSDILGFETDLAQLVELIIIFCESEGSLAELGAFSMVEEIAQRLFVIIRSKHWYSKSFIKLGPLRLIENCYGRDSIYVLYDDDIGMKGDLVSGVDKNALGDLLDQPLRKRLSAVRVPTTFDSKRAGHLTKLIVGFIQEYGALLSDEIYDLLCFFQLDVPHVDIHKYLSCAITLQWIVKVLKRGKGLGRGSWP